MTDKKCIICNGMVEFLLTKEEYNLWKCTSCGLVFVDPQPSDSFLEKKVYSAESGYQANKRKDLANAVPDTKTERILADLRQWQSSHATPGRLLDVGCSNGEFMYHAKKIGFDVVGVEVNKRTADIATANGLNVFNGFLHDAQYAAESFDIIFLGDIIEHVSSPRAFVEECNRLLKKGGHIIISTPNLDCFWSRATFILYRLCAVPWSSVTPPHHLYQFSFDNLVDLMAQYKLTLSDSFFLRPPRLMYELGGLHLMRRFKKRKTLGTALFAVFSYSLYTVFYCLDTLLTPFKHKDFSMVVTFKK